MSRSHGFTRESSVPRPEPRVRVLGKFAEGGPWIVLKVLGIERTLIGRYRVTTTPLGRVVPSSKIRNYEGITKYTPENRILRSKINGDIEVFLRCVGSLHYYLLV